jgi:hypothetical protein
LTPLIHAPFSIWLRWFMFPSLFGSADSNLRLLSYSWNSFPVIVGSYLISSCYWLN